MDNNDFSVLVRVVKDQLEKDGVSTTDFGAACLYMAFWQALNLSVAVGDPKSDVQNMPTNNLEEIGAVMSPNFREVFKISWKLLIVLGKSYITPNLAKQFYWQIEHTDEGKDEKIELASAYFLLFLRYHKTSIEQWLGSVIVYCENKFPKTASCLDALINNEKINVLL